MSHRTLIQLGIFIIAVPFAGTAQAMRMPDPPLAELVRQADVIMHGSVEATSSEWLNDEWGNHIWTTWSIRVIDGIKGAEAGQVLTLRMIGGTVGDMTELVFDVPRPPSGGEAIFLLSADAQTSTLALVSALAVEQGTVTVGAGRGVAVSEFNNGIRDFLSGKSHAVKELLAEEMEKASHALDFERAAIYRDRLAALSAIQSQQGVNLRGVDDADVFAIHQAGGYNCVQVFFFRTGQNWGNRAYFPKAARGVPADEVLNAFIAQFYDDKPCPRTILVSEELPERALLAEALSRQSRRIEM